MMDFKLYICYAADGYNIEYFVQHHVIEYFFNIMSDIDDGLQVIYICTKKLPRRHVQMSRRPLPQKRLKQREEKAYSCLFQHDGFRPTKTSEITPRL